MKAPELPTIIYFTILDMGSGYVYTPSLDDNGGTEYIRKDALLEWLNERYKSTISNVGCYTGHSVWAEVIEHINEM